MKHSKFSKIVSILTSIFVICLFSVGFVYAESESVLPSGADPQVGDPSITTSPDGLDMTVDAGGHNKTWIDWQGGFNIGVPNTVNNLGPSSQAVILHNDVSGDISSIRGNLLGNCNVFITNPNGVMFGASSYVDVPGLVTSSLNISQENFVNGNYRFKEYGDKIGASVINKGYIKAKSVALIGHAVENEGSIVTTLGKTTLAAGEEMTLNLDTAGMISVAIDEAVKEKVIVDGEEVKDGVKNTGTIQADGGIIVLTAKAMDKVFDYAVNQEGIIEANSLVGDKGEVFLLAEGDNQVAANTGTIDVSAAEAGADGGFVEISAPNVQIGGNIDVTSIDAEAGELLIDPWNIHIVSPYDFHWYTLFTHYDSTPEFEPAGSGDNILPPETLLSYIEEDWLEGFLGNLTLEAGNDVSFELSGYHTDRTWIPRHWEGWKLIPGHYEYNNWVDDNELNLQHLDSFTVEAGRHIELNNDSIVTQGADVTLNADVAIDPWGLTQNGKGDVDLGTGNGIISNGGNISIAGVNVHLTSLVDATGGTGNGNVDAVAGNHLVFDPSLTGNLNAGADLTLTGIPGTENSPFTASIQAAIDAIGTIGGTSTINVGAATYNENIIIDKPLILLGAQANVDPTIVGGRTGVESIIDTGGGTIDLEADNIALDGFTLTGGTGLWLLNNKGSNNVIEDNIFCDNGSSAIWGSYDNQGLVIQDNLFKNNGVDGYEVTGINLQTKNWNTTIEGNKFLVPSGAGDHGAVVLLYFSNGHLNDSAGKYIDIIDNEFISESDGNWYAIAILNSDHTTIAKNTFENWNNAAITLQQNGVDDTIIEENYFTNNYRDLKVYNYNITNTKVYNNSFTKSELYSIYSETSNLIDASANWWGSNDESTVEAGISGLVDFTPFLNSGTDTDGTPGFQGDFSTLNVTALGEQTGSKGRIQEGIDLVDGSTVNVGPGTYNESILIDKTLTLLGAQADVDPRPSAGGRTGAESIIDAGESSSYVVRIADASDVEINGFTITGGTGDMVDEDVKADNLLLQYNIFYDDLDSTGDEAVQIKYSNGVVIQNNYAYDILQDAFNLSSSTNGLITNNEAHDIYSENAAIYCYDATNINIIGNLVYEVPNNDGIKLGDSDDGSTGGTVSGNTVYNAAQDGITIYASGVTVENNTIYGCDSENGALYLYGADNTIVKNNQIYDNDAIGLLIKNSDNVEVEGNEIYNNIDTNDTKLPGSAGIWLTSDATNVTINENDIYSNLVGIEVQGNILPIITDNCFADNTNYHVQANSGVDGSNLYDIYNIYSGKGNTFDEAGVLTGSSGTSVIEAPAGYKVIFSSLDNMDDQLPDDPDHNNTIELFHRDKAYAYTWGDFNTQGSNLVFNSEGDLILDYGPIETGGGYLEINVLDPDLILNTSINTGGADLSLSAVGSIIHNAGGDITTSGGNYTGNADSDGDETGDYLMNTDSDSGDDAFIDTAGGNIKIIAGDDSDLFTLAGGGDITVNGEGGNRIIHPHGGSTYLATGKGNITGDAYIAIHGNPMLLYAPSGYIGQVGSPFNLKGIGVAAYADGPINLNERTGLDVVSVEGVEGIISDDSDVKLTVNGDLRLNNPIKSNASDGLVDIDSSGAIIDNNGNTNNITSTNLILSARDGIGSGDALETNISTLTARVTNGTATGNIEIDNTSSDPYANLRIEDIAGWGYAINNAGSGDIILNNNARFFLADLIQTNGGEVRIDTQGLYQASNGDIITNGGDVDIRADGVDGLGGLIDAGNGKVTVESTNASIRDRNGSDINIIADEAVLIADDGIFDWDNPGEALETQVNKIAVLNKSTGDIRILNIGDLAVETIDGVVGIHNTAPDDSVYVETQSILKLVSNIESVNLVRLTAAGALSDYVPGYADIVADELALDVESGIIGKPSWNNTLETRVKKLAAFNSTSGNLAILNDGELEITDVDDILGITNNGGSIDIATFSPLTVNSDVIAQDDIYLSAKGATEADVTINANVTSNNSGTIDIYADSDIIHDSKTVSSDGIINETAMDNLVMNNSSAITGDTVNLNVGDASNMDVYGNMIMSGSSKVKADKNVNADISNNLIMAGDSKIRALKNVKLDIGNNVFMFKSSKVKADKNVNADISNNLIMAGDSKIRALKNVNAEIDNNVWMVGSSKIKSKRNVNLDVYGKMRMRGDSKVGAGNNTNVIVADFFRMYDNSSIDPLNVNVDVGWLEMYNDSEISAENNANVHSDHYLHMYQNSDIRALHNANVDANNIQMHGKSMISADNNSNVTSNNNLGMFGNSKIKGGKNANIDIYNLRMHQNSEIVTDTKNVNIVADNNVEMFNLSDINAGRNVDIDAGGQVLVSNDTITAGHNVWIDAVDNITLGKIFADNNIWLTTTSGSIVDNNDWDINLTGKKLYLDAANNIGSVSVSLWNLSNKNNYKDMINTDVDVIEANSDSGNIFILEKDEVTLNDFYSGGGIIGVGTGGDTVINTMQAGGTPPGPPLASLTATPSGSLSASLIAVLSAGDITANDVSAYGDDIAAVVLGSAGKLIANDVGAESNSLSGVGLLSLGDLTTNNVQAIGDMAGVLGISAFGDIYANSITANGSSLGGILLGAGYGDITLGDLESNTFAAAIALGLDGEGNIYDDGDVITDYLALIAKNDIGQAGGAPIQTQVDYLTAYSFDSGDIYIDEEDSIQLGFDIPNIKLTNLYGFNIQNIAQNWLGMPLPATLKDLPVVAADGSVYVTAGGDIDVYRILATEKISLVSDNAINDVNDNSEYAYDIKSTDLYLEAVNGIGDGDALETEVSTLNAYNSDENNIEIINDGNLFAESVVNDGDDIIITVNSDLELGYIESAGDSILTAATGSIVDDDTDDSVDVVADGLAMDAASGIGVGNPIETEVNTLAASAVDGVEIVNTNASGVTIGTVGSLSGVTGSYVTIEETLGDITIDDVSVESTSGDVDLTSTLGSIYAIGPATHIIAAGDSSLIAYLGVVGTIAGDPLAGYGPVNVDITGNLTIIAGGVGTALVNGSITPWAGTYWPVSSNIAGIVEGSTTYTGAYAGDPAANIVIIPADSSFPGALVFDPPGYVFFNTTEIWPHLPLPNSIDYLTGRAILPIQEILAISRMSTVNLPFNNNTIYGYHPVTPFDVSAFEGYTMSEDMYEFIEGQLQLKEGNFFSWFEEEMKKKKTQL